MPKNKKPPKDLTNEEIAKFVFPKKLLQKIRDKIKEIDGEKKSKIDSNSSSQG